MLNAVLDEDALYYNGNKEKDLHLRPMKWIMFAIGFLCGIIFSNLCRGDEYNCNPIRQTNIQYSAHLSDLGSHCSRPDIYRDPDCVTWAHELTHGVNSDLRNSTPPGDAFFYVYNSKAFRVLVPRNATMVQVKLRLPYTGTAFQTYFSTLALAHWNDDITYFMDEWCAYLNGCMCGLEQHVMGRTVESFDSANQLGLYSILATKHLNQKDINDFIKFQMDRTEVIRSALPNYNQQYYNTLKQYYSGKVIQNNNVEIIKSE